ncbi:hypothetical protein KQ302_04760 [Synechococcus sp. CS-602]|nr:hypothetical protein BM449_02965 [Synechococcus sp. SynAce01]MCT0202621.1 hypothetical protein [Synechococcus sp. CS-603]MCT0204425.1 hypothetical protein [Synechococcus sp. CS-602]MCT0247267.1 hypothetical protein [Synechococcus sp. CS-601]
MLSSALTLALLMGGCSGNPVAEQLAAGFESPASPATPPAPTPAPPATAETPASPATPGPTTPATTTATTTAPTATPAPATPAKPVAGAMPYRITIQLSGVDPAAPAEAVTAALRKAGVRFEVETIERIPQAGAEAKPSGPGQAATSSAAPAPR